MKLLLAIVVGVIATQAQAQTYRCTVNGKTIYADAPCAPDARNVGALQDRLTEEQQIQRLQQSIKERRQRNAIDGQQELDYQSRQRAITRQAQAEAAQSQANEEARQRRCGEIARDMKWNRESVVRYQGYGWQHQLTDQEQQLKQNRELYDRDCR